jgi:ATPase subunit of ABC transporter with duplicated ATPase domains
MITVSDLKLGFGDRILFKDVNLKFTPGNCYGLIGANGSGKSTLVKILAGLMPASAGEVSIGKDCTLGYLRQDHAEFDHVSILDTVYMGNRKLSDLHREREALYSKTELTEAEHDRCDVIEHEFS